MKILFAAPENAWGGFFYAIQSELPDHEFVAAGRYSIDTLKGFHVLIPTMTIITRKIIEESDRLQLIQQCGAGLESVDLEAARRNNIWVANVPTDMSGNAESVAELGIYMMIGLSRNFREFSQSFANQRIGEPQGRALKGKTIGLVGLGGIGKALVKRLKPFDVHLIGIKRVNPQKAMSDLDLEWVGTPKDMKILLEKSDFVILCLPLTAKSRHIMNRDSFSNMKQNAYLINLSRGDLVNREALENALYSGKIAGAGLDVFWEEPPNPDESIFKYNVLATPHIAGATDVSMKGILKVTADNIRRVEKGLKPFYCVN